MRKIGAVYTPADFAQFLVSWAILCPSDQVLDLGVGEGIFVFSAYERLKSLGRSKHEAQAQIYGAEVNGIAYEKFVALSNKLALHFENIHLSDYFCTQFPVVDAIVGNPPYVRRSDIAEVSAIRHSVVRQNRSIAETQLSRLTDLYVYFLLHALPTLRPGGRLAVLTADSWLNARYGEVLKDYLKQQFEINDLISVDRRIFDGAEVKAVILLATKRQSVHLDHEVRFLRVRNGVSAASLSALNDQNLSNPLAARLESRDLELHTARQRELETSAPWGLYFRVPKAHMELVSHPMLSPISSLAVTRVGIQTLAREFFVLDADKVRVTEIEPEYLRPLALSPRFLIGPVIEPGTNPLHYVLYCSRKKDDLEHSKVLEYINGGESISVGIRGKNAEVIGYHNKERIKRSGRLPWYDLKTTVDRRGIAQILVPRLMYHSFAAIWNKAQFVPGELFIEFLPLFGIEAEVYLAILSGTLSEIMLRAHSQVYGGGTFNLNPGQIKRVPILDATLLTIKQREELKSCYYEFVLDKEHDRTRIDEVIYQILGFDTSRRENLRHNLMDLVQMTSSAKKFALAS